MNINMTLSKKTLVAASVAALMLTAPAAQAGKDKIRIGVMSDQSGPFQDINGKGSVMAARMAIEEFGGKVIGKPIELLDADPQNKPDVGAAIARTWIERDKVDLLADMPVSPVGLATLQILKNNKNGILLVSGPQSPQFTGAQCAPYVMSWSIDQFALANMSARPLVAQGQKDWFLIQVDWAPGTSGAAQFTKVLGSIGGRIVGHVKHPVKATDYSSYALQAQASKAQVIALIQSGEQMISTVRALNEFQVLKGGVKLVAGLGTSSSEIKSMGLQVAQGIVSPAPFEALQSPEAAAWSKKFLDRFGKMPTGIQIGQYSQVLHYLKAVQAAKTDDRLAVAKKMREMPVNDAFVKNGHVRADGRMVHDVLLLQVKSPAESKSEWDLYKVVAHVPGDKAFTPVAESGCAAAMKR